MTQSRAHRGGGARDRERTTTRKIIGTVAATLTIALVMAGSAVPASAGAYQLDDSVTANSSSSPFLSKFPG